MGPRAEPEVVREYRHLLRTASADWQETAHRHALVALGPGTRAEVLDQVRRVLLTGYRYGADDVHAVARLIVLAERRRPRTVLDGFPAGLLARLAEAVVVSPTGRMLQAGIDVWDGTEPAAVPEPGPQRDTDGADGWSRTEFGTVVAPPDIGTAWTGLAPLPLRRP
jgi:hypothetical protein